MARFAVGRAGIVINVVEAPSADLVGSTDDVFEDTAGTINVGAAYDVKDVRMDRADVVIHEILFRTINDVRVLKGQAQFTRAQYRAFVKTLMT